MSERGAVVKGLGIGLPKIILDNESVIAMGKLDSSDAWIRANTGIHQRHIIGPEESVDQLGAEASMKALEMAGIDPKTLGQILVASISQERNMPPIAIDIHERIHAGYNTAAFDALAACAGSIYGLANAYDAHASGRINNSVVVGAETLSKFVDWNDRATAILFGDGAGAVALQTVDNPGVQHFVLGARPAQRDLNFADGSNHKKIIEMAGPAVYKVAIPTMTDVSIRALEGAKLTNSQGQIYPDVAKHIILVPHQANIRIMNKVAEQLHEKIGFPREHMVSVIDKYANTSAASVFLALHDAYVGGRLNKDDLVLMVAIGGGYAYGAGVIQWHLDNPNPKGDLTLAKRLSVLGSEAAETFRAMFRTATTSSKPK